MRPTITEQLHQAVRVLGADVLPEVDGRYAAEPLRSVIAALEWIVERWETVVADLYAECDDWAALLGPAGSASASASERNRLPDDLGVALDALSAETATGARAPTFPAAHALNLRWRALVAEVVPVLDGAADPGSLPGDVRAQLLRHAQRW